MRRKLSRRTFLRSATTGAALALPLLSDFDHDAHGAAADPKTFKRLIVIFTPNGQVTQAWKSSGAGANFALGEIQTPLAAHKKDIVVVHNLDMSAALNGPGGDAHGLGIGCMLTGTELLAGDQFKAGMGGAGSGWPGGISVDQYIARKVGTSTKFRSLEFSMKRAAGTIWTRMSYLGPSQPVTPYDDPQTAFDKIFGDIGVNPALLARRKARRQSVLDGVISEFGKLSTSLSGSDKKKVEEHLAAIRNIENQLKNMDPGAGACVPPQRPVLGSTTEVIRNASGMEVSDPNSHADVPERQALWRKLMIAALACDLTRVTSFIMAPSRSDIFMNWLNIPLLSNEAAGTKHSHHDYSHLDNSYGSGSGKALVQINQWYAGQIAALVADMKATKEGAGTMFDNSVILWCNELGVGESHSHTNIPFLTIGNAGGVIKTGQSITMPGGSSHNGLLISLVNAMGIPDTIFGNPKHCVKGPIPGFAV